MAIQNFGLYEVGLSSIATFSTHVAVTWLNLVVLLIHDVLIVLSTALFVSFHQNSKPPFSERVHDTSQSVYESLRV